MHVKPNKVSDLVPFSICRTVTVIYTDTVERIAENILLSIVANIDHANLASDYDGKAHLEADFSIDEDEQDVRIVFLSVFATSSTKREAKGSIVFSDDQKSKRIEEKQGQFNEISSVFCIKKSSQSY